MSGHLQLVALQTIFTREVRRFMRIWVQTLVPPAITITLYFFIFGKLIGARVGEMQGVSYINFVVPGLIMMSVIMSAYNNVVSSFFGAKFTRSIEELLVSPVANGIILLGFVMGGVVRGLLVGMVVTLLSFLFTRLPVYNLPLLIVVVLLASLLFSLAGFLNAVYARNFDDITIVPTFVLTPLIYLGGVFYSVSLLSDFWEGVSRLNPILYMVNAFRYGFLGISDINVFASVMIIAVLVVLQVFLCLYLLRRSVRLRK